MTVLTGADGQLKYNNRTVAKVRDWSLTVSKDAVEDTCLGVYDRTYIEGLRGATGSASLLYDPSEAIANDLLNSIFKNDDESAEVAFVMNRNNYANGGGTFTCNAFITNVSPSVSVGAAQAVSVSFQVSGPIDGKF